MEGEALPEQLLYEARTLLDEAAISSSDRRHCLGSFARFFSSPSSLLGLTVGRDDLLTWSIVFGNISQFFRDAASIHASADDQLQGLVAFSQSPIRKRTFQERVNEDSPDPFASPEKRSSSRRGSAHQSPTKGQGSPRRSPGTPPVSTGSPSHGLRRAGSRGSPLPSMIIDEVVDLEE
jgi:hypothetical protein